MTAAITRPGWRRTASGKRAAEAIHAADKLNSLALKVDEILEKHCF
jgi:hypothetical protein